MRVHRCTRCNELLRGRNVLWLELDQKDGAYHVLGDVPPERSQGAFPFGLRCAQIQLKRLSPNAQEQGMNLNKDPASWRRVSVEAVMAGSKAQGENVLRMAIEDILRLADRQRDPRAGAVACSHCGGAGIEPDR